MCERFPMDVRPMVADASNNLQRAYARCGLERAAVVRITWPQSACGWIRGAQLSSCVRGLCEGDGCNEKACCDHNATVAVIMFVHGASQSA